MYLVISIDKYKDIIDIHENDGFHHQLSFVLSDFFCVGCKIFQFQLKKSTSSLKYKHPHIKP